MAELRQESSFHEYESEAPPSDLLWFKDAIIYQLHVRAFQDSDNDGIGDFQGLIERLDYLSDLGVTAIWLLPFYPSPLKDDGYDIADYMNINPAYGTLDDFKRFMREAHARGMKVITELVINHTSDQHEWFQKSRRAKPGGYWRDFYVWSDNPQKYKEARIIFKDFEASNWSWDPVAKSYYWHRFFNHQPDLNFDNPEVKTAVFAALDFWMDMGVDGMRLDAVPYLFEREGTSCENLPETHAFLKELRAYMDAKYPGRMILAEANQWPEDAAAYFGEGNECHMNFHFPLMPRLFMAIKMEDRYSIIDILRQTPAIPDNCQWATFLRNHDELTLEMVTDEERDYMYKVYSADPRARINLGIRRRLAPLVDNDRRQIELLNGLLFSLGGTPIIYYGDEIGMGDNIYLGDRNGVRTPFQWSPDRNAGFSKANPHSLFLPVILSPEYHFEANNVETAQSNPNSLLWWMKKLIGIRKSFPELSRGDLRFLGSENPRVLSFTRQQNGRTLLIVANLSRTVQHVELDLSDYRGHVPVELFGQSDFPTIGDLPYFLTLAPYGFYWFELVEKQSLDQGQWLIRDTRPVEVSEEPLSAIAQAWPRLEKDLRSYLKKARWFAGKARKIMSVAAEDIVYLKQYQRPERSALVVTRVNYREGDPELYALAISYAEGERAESIVRERPDLVIARYVKAKDKDQGGVYYDAIVDPGFSQSLLDMCLRSGELRTRNAQIKGVLVESSRKSGIDQEIPSPTLKGLEQSNSSVIFGDTFYLKIYRKLDEGENPEVEIGRQLTVRHPFTHMPPVIASLDYVRGKKRCSLGIAQKFTPSETDGWNLILRHIANFADGALASGSEVKECSRPAHVTSADLLSTPVPQALQDLSGPTFALARLLGQRTAEMHTALAADDENPAFVPEPYTPFYQRSLFQSMRNLTDRSLSLLRRVLPELTPESRELADRVLSFENELYGNFSWLKHNPVEAYRIRVHGDYHLGQVLYTGDDFVIVDFEGEPARPVSERKLKRTPLKDVAGMLRSFEYAAEYHLKTKLVRPEDREHLSGCLRSWAWWLGNEFLKGYLNALQGSPLLPSNPPALFEMLHIHVLEKALYELVYELSSRPDWVEIPIRGILTLLGHEVPHEQKA
jgi:maltose alpha-D-glucosyltransferase/alpha-amylase